MDTYLQAAKTQMNETFNALLKDFSGIRSGRATAGLLEPIKVEAYGGSMPLNQCASVNVTDSTTLSVQVWDRSLVGAVEKAIVNCGAGFNPTIEGQSIRVPVPKPSEERRMEFVKLAKKYTEDKKVSLRNVRRNSLESYEKEFKNKVSEDELHHFRDEIQKLTDNYTKMLEDALKKKEQDILNL